MEESNSYEGKTAVVIGAGPAGTCAATYLVRHNFNVKVFERRTDFRSAVEDGTKAYVVGLNGATTKTLKDIHVALPPPTGRELNGLHTWKATILVKDGHRIVLDRTKRRRLIGTRLSISTEMYKAVISENPDRIRVAFEHTLKSVDFDKQEVVVENSRGDPMTVSYDLLISAEGNRSVIRDELSRYDPSFKFEVVDGLLDYQVINTLGDPEGSDMYVDATQPGRLLMNTTNLTFSDGSAQVELYTFRDRQERILGALRYAYGASEYLKTKDPKTVEAAFPEDFPKNWRAPLAEACSRGVRQSSPPLIKISNMNGRRTLIIGDAAHGTTALYGFGCNMAIGDGATLNEALNMGKGDIDAALKCFNELRYEEVQAYISLEESQPGFSIRLKGMRKLWPFLVDCHNKLSRILPGRRNRATATMRVSAENAKAKEVVNEIRRDFITFLGVVILIQCIAGAVLVKTWTGGWYHNCLDG